MDRPGQFAADESKSDRLLGHDRRWRLAPAFDLRFSTGPMGKHHMDICGEGNAVKRGHLLRLASEGGVPLAAAEVVIEQMLAQAKTIARRLTAFPIRRTTVQRIKVTVETCRKQLASDLQE